MTVAVRPGVVNTEMQQAIRERGAEHMSEKDHARFTGLHAEGKLVEPEQAGAVLASLALRGAKDLSGTFVSWDATEMEDYRTV